MSLLGSSFNKTAKHESFDQQSEILSSIVEESHIAGSKRFSKKDSKQPERATPMRHVTSKKQQIVYRPPPTTGDQQFLQLYDENIQLKKKQQEMEKVNRNLDDKIAELKGMINKNQADPLLRTVDNKEVMELIHLKKENRELNRTVSLMKSNKAHSAVKQHAGKVLQGYEREKVQDLLKIIEFNKKTIRDMELQIKTLQRENYLLKSQSVARDTLGQKEMADMEHEFKKQRDAQHRARDKERQLDMARQKVGFLEAEIGRLQTQISTQSILELEVQDLRVENRKLEDSIRRLSESPVFKGVTDKVEDETKIRSLESRCKILDEAQHRHKEKVIGLQTELKLVQGQLIEMTYDAQEKEKQNMKLKEKVREHPIITMLLQDEETMYKVIGFLRSQNYSHATMELYSKDAASGKHMEGYGSELSQGAAKKKIEALICEKEELAIELHRTEGMLKALRESYQQREKIHNIEEKMHGQQLQDQQKKIKDLEVMVGHKTKAEAYSGGVRYIDSVSMFSDDSAKCESGSNMFDLYLGGLVMVEQIVRLQTSTADPTKLITFLTVDFYNHNTENSKLGTSCNYNVNSQFSFKVTEDSFFMGFLEKGYVNIEVWCSEGSKAVSLGVCKIALKSLLIKAKQNVAPVVNSSCPIYLNSKATGTLNFVMRMRFPLADHQKQYKLEEHDTGSRVEPGEHRKLVINISQGSGMRSGSNSFVYYNLRGNDHYTNTYSGSNPVWDHWNIIDTNYTQDFRNYLRNSELELIVLDDNAPLSDPELSDVVGTATLTLTSLLENNQIDVSLPLKKGNNTAGSLKLKIFWYDKDNAALMGIINKPQSKQKEEQEDLRLATNDKLLQYFKRNRLSSDEAFYKFDNNKTGVVSRAEFEAGLINIGIRLNKQEFNTYYGQFEQPINQLNFNRIFFPEEVRTESRVNTRQSQQPQLPTQSRLPTHSQITHTASRETIPHVDSFEDLNKHFSNKNQPTEKPLVESIKEINKFMKKNTVDLKRMTLREFLKGRENELLTIALDIDKNNDGTISREELQSYLDSHGVDAVIEEDRVNLMDFLKKYSSKEDKAAEFGGLGSALPIRSAVSIIGDSTPIPRRFSKK